MGIISSIKHVVDVLVCDGKKRFTLSIVHILYVALAYGCVLFLSWGIANFAALMAQNVLYPVGLVIGFVIAVPLGIYMFILGVIGQILTVVSSFFGFIFRGQRLYNLMAFLLSVVSIALLAYLLREFYVVWIEQWSANGI